MNDWMIRLVCVRCASVAQYVVTWTAFEEAVQGDITAVDSLEAALTAFRYILGKAPVCSIELLTCVHSLTYHMPMFWSLACADNCGTGFVTLYKFAEFLKGFGPFSRCINNVRTIMRII